MRPKNDCEVFEFWARSARLRGEDFWPTHDELDVDELPTATDRSRAVAARDDGAFWLQAA
jgi:hypothetical protein